MSSTMLDALEALTCGILPRPSRTREPHGEPECTASLHCLQIHGCNRGCQRTSHPQAYTTRIQQRLHRAGEILQAVFRVWRMHTFEWKIFEVWKNRESDILEVDGILYPTRSVEWPFCPFPKEIIEDPADQRTMLSFLTCAETNEYLHEVIEGVLADITTSIEDIEFETKPGAFKLHFQDIYGQPRFNCDGHTVLAIETVDGNAYIVDITGAQLSQNTTIPPFDEYMDTGIVTKLINVDPFGYALEEGEKYRAGHFDGVTGKKSDFRGLHLRHEMHLHMAKTIKQWKVENGMKLSQLRDGSTEEFEEGLASMVRTIDEALEAFAVRWEKNGQYVKPYSTGEDVVEEREDQNEEPGCEDSPATRRWEKYCETHREMHVCCKIC